MLFRVRCFLLLIGSLLYATPALSETFVEDWLGLWIGESQIGDFPDFGTFSLGDDYILINGYDEEMNLLVTGQTHFNMKRNGDIGGKGVVSGQTTTVKGPSCTVTLEKKQSDTRPSSEDYLLAESDTDCGSMYARFIGKYYRFKNSERN